MIEYVIGHNPDDRIIKKASNLIKRGGLISFPLDTNWVIACDPFSPEAIEKIYRIRKIDAKKHLSLICKNFQKASELALIQDSAYSLIKKVIPGPYTFIFLASKNVRKSLKASKTDHEVGIRFPDNKFCQKLLEELDRPLTATHLTIDMFENADQELGVYSALIEDEFSRDIDLIIDTGEYSFIESTSIISFTTPTPQILRIGSGRTDLFVT